jgi:hypothetical protein
LGTADRIASQRLVNQHLVKPTLASASDVVALLGAVQAQDYGSAKWALAQRTSGATDADVETEIAAGAILRTHILRPTWHFVAPADIGWMLTLSAPRVHAANAYWYRWLEVDDAVARRSRAVLTKALRDGKQLTRAELGQVLTRAKIQVGTPQRLACIVMRAELDGLICSGARRGKQFTYALLEELVPRPRTLERDEALHELAKRYFSTRGPATADDFAWWSGLTKAEAKRAAQSTGRELEQRMIDGKPYWFPTPARPARRKTPMAHLLPNYDEYFVGFKDRSAFSERLRAAGIEARTDALSGHILAINGQIVGGWGRIFRGKEAVIRLKLLQKLTAEEKRAVGSAAKRFTDFLGMPVRIQQ